MPEYLVETFNTINLNENINSKASQNWKPILMSTTPNVGNAAMPVLVTILFERAKK